MDRFDHLSKLQFKMQSQRYAEPGNESRVDGSFMSSQLSRENFGGEQGAQGQELSQVTLANHQPAYGKKKGGAAYKNQYSKTSQDDEALQSYLSKLSCSLRLKIKYETHFGQYLCVVGSIKQLGMWKEYVYDLAWTPGHVWVSKEPIVAEDDLFQYKYVLMKDGKVEKWERGINRIADVKVLARSRLNSRQRQSSPMMRSALNTFEDERFQLELEDEWERYKLQLSLVIPTAMPILSVSCSGNDGLDFQLTRGEPMEWSLHKYGDPQIQPWIGSAILPNRSGDRCGQWKNKDNSNLSCQFRIQTAAGFHEERRTFRHFAIESPEHALGKRSFGRSALYCCADQLFIVNGQLNLACGSYIFDFQVHPVLNEQICYGGHPESLIDFRTIKSLQCSTVFNIMTKREMETRQLSDDFEQMLCKQANLNYVPFPIADSDSIDKVTDKMFQACLILNDLINSKGEKVFVHCLSGTARSPTLILLFQCLYRQQNTPQQQIPSIQHLYKLCDEVFVDQVKQPGQAISSAHGSPVKPFVLPNMDIVTRALQKEATFYQNSQRQIQEQQHAHNVAQVQRQEQLNERSMQMQALRQQQQQQEEEARARREQERRLEEERIRKLQEDAAERERHRLEDERVMREKELERQRALEEQRQREEEERRFEEEERRRCEEEERRAEEERLEFERQEKERQQQEERRLRELELKRMQEQYEREEIERQRAKIIAEEEARNLQRRLRRLQDGELPLAIPTAQKASHVRLPLASKEHHLNLSQPNMTTVQQPTSASQSPKSYGHSPKNYSQGVQRSMHQSPQHQRMDTETELRKLADQRFKQMQEQEELVKQFSAQRQQLVQQEDPGDEEKTSFDQSTSPSRKPRIECAFGDEELLGLSEAELDLQCDDLFADTPIPFRPRKGDPLDTAIMEQIELLGITIPVQHVRGKLYLIGSSKTTCELKGEQLLIRTGGGYERFDEYVPSNHRFFQRQLVVAMIKSGQGLEDTVQNFIDGKKFAPSVNATQLTVPEQHIQQEVQTPSTPRRRQYEAKTVAIDLKTQSIRKAQSSLDKFSARTANSSGERKRISFRDLVQPYSLKGAAKPTTAMSPSPRRFGPPRSKLIQNATRAVQQRHFAQGAAEGGSALQARTREANAQDGSPVMRRGRGLRARHNFQAPLRVRQGQTRDAVLADIQGQKQTIITRLRKTFEPAHAQTATASTRVEDQLSPSHHGTQPYITKPSKQRALESLQKKYQQAPSGQSQGKRSQVTKHQSHGLTEALSPRMLNRDLMGTEYQYSQPQYDESYPTNQMGL